MAPLILGFLALCIVFYVVILKDLPNPMGLRNYKIIPVASQILDRNGKLLYEVYRDEKRTPVDLKELPDHIKQATISIEDKDFYRHQGVSLFSGIFRAIKETLLHKGLQGGSTLTQQLVKSALLTPERTIKRKVKEIVLALWTEQLFTKDEILEMYLNQVPYGGNAYGIEEAATTYFNKHAKDLTLAEATYLAGLPQAPSLYSPYHNPDLAKRRQTEVVNKMAEYGYLSQEKRNEILNQKMKVAPQRTYIKAPHFVFYVKKILEQQYGADELELGGLKIYTTLDLDIQQKAEQIVRDQLEKVANLNVGNGAALITRPSTGEILTMVGSKDYFATPSGSFNVTTALRQPGSSIKPINYAIGIDRKIVTPATVFLDVPTCFPSFPKKYCPVNYDSKFHGPVQLRFAL
ncbi:MAG TPA: transglycosylase domain-containing protein, partial [Candidatus Nitrosocosmicus sp.]|nr:transglycosylase domain-containing protein [Candidatus Nitrosocosmicus sp.]